MMAMEEWLNKTVASSGPLRLTVQTLNALLLPIMALEAAWVTPRASWGTIMLIILLAYAVNMFLGAMIHSVRPYRTNHSLTLLQNKPWTEKSFPSDHAMLAFLLAGVIALLEPSWAVIVFGGAFVVALCRVAVGVHTMRDVAAGGLLGVGWTLFIGYLISSYIKL